MNALPLLLLLVAGGRAPHPLPSSAAAQAPAASQPALSDEEVVRRVHGYLGSIDTPITAEQWRALGPRAVAPLTSVATDPEALPTRRAKAISALSILGGEQARQVVLDAARSDGEPFAVRASALHGAGRLLDAKALSAALRPVLQKAPQAPVRATAAEVLAHHAGASGCAAVRAQVRREPDDARGHYARALKRCQAEP